MFTGSSTETIAVDGKVEGSSILSYTANQLITVKETVATSTTVAVVVGVTDTTNLKYMKISNTGAQDMSAMTINGAGTDFPLKAGESLVFAGAQGAKKVLDALSTVTSVDTLSVTAPGTGPVSIEVVALVNP